MDNIPLATAKKFREHYNDDSIDGDDIFYYVYGVLHNSEYKTKFAANLKKTLPRIPFAKSADDFHKYAKAGKQLGKLHTNYENEKPYPLKIIEENTLLENPDYYRVVKMKYPNKNDKTKLAYNANITIENIPADAQRYVVNGKSAVEWIMDRYCVKTDKASGIVNDANQWSDDPKYIINLLCKVVTVSVETMKIVDALPPLFETQK